MRRHQHHVLLTLCSTAVLALVVGAAGCSTSRQAGDATVATADAAAAEVTTTTPAPPATSDPTPRTITVTALGSADGSPDSLVLSLGVEVFGASTGEALANLAAKAGTLTTFLRDLAGLS
jgi:uncharacterized protein YggE